MRLIPALVLLQLQRSSVTDLVPMSLLAECNTVKIIYLQKQVDSSLSKNQALISYTTVITIIIKYTMTSMKVT